MTAADEDQGYPADAEKLVVAGFAAIRSEVDLVRKRGLIARGATTADYIRSEPWDSKPLLNSQKLGEFTRHLMTERLDDVLLAIWYILENRCDEKRLRPYITIDPSSGESVVRLGL